MQALVSRALLAVGTLLFVREGEAFVGPVTAVPSVLTEGEQGSVKVTMGACDLLGGENGAVIDQSVDGDVVNVTVSGHTIIFDDFCIIPSTEYAVPFGPLPAGQYTVRLFRRENDPPNPVDLLGEASVVVVPAVQSIPALGGEMLGLLTTLILVGGWKARRNWHRSQ